jgi:hypothetical protein
VTIEADPGAQVALDGSDPALNDPAVNNWTLYQGNIYYTDLAWGDKVCNNLILPGYVGEQRGGDGIADGGQHYSGNNGVTLRCVGRLWGKHRVPEETAEVSAGEAGAKTREGMDKKQGLW